MKFSQEGLLYRTDQPLVCFWGKEAQDTRYRGPNPLGQRALVTSFRLLIKQHNNPKHLLLVGHPIVDNRNRTFRCQYKYTH